MSQRPFRSFCGNQNTWRGKINAHYHHPQVRFVLSWPRPHARRAGSSNGGFSGSVRLEQRGRCRYRRSGIDKNAPMCRCHDGFLPPLRRWRQDGCPRARGVAGVARTTPGRGYLFLGAGDTGVAGSQTGRNKWSGTGRMSYELFSGRHARSYVRLSCCMFSWT